MYNTYYHSLEACTSCPIAPPTMPSFKLRPATEQDVTAILRIIRELALYEKEPDRVLATEDSLRKTLFGHRAYAEVVLAVEAESPETAIGMALFFHDYSTWLGKPGIYLEGALRLWPPSICGREAGLRSTRRSFRVGNTQKRRGRQGIVRLPWQDRKGERLRTIELVCPEMERGMFRRTASTKSRLTYCLSLRSRSTKSSVQRTWARSGTACV